MTTDKIQCSGIEFEEDVFYCGMLKPVVDELQKLGYDVKNPDVSAAIMCYFTNVGDRTYLHATSENLLVMGEKSTVDVVMQNVRKHLSKVKIIEGSDYKIGVIEV